MMSLVRFLEVFLRVRWTIYCRPQAPVACESENALSITLLIALYKVFVGDFQPRPLCSCLFQTLTQASLQDLVFQSSVSCMFFHQMEYLAVLSLCYILIGL